MAQTPAQLAAERANLAKARAAKKGKPLSAKARAADLANLAKARAKRKASSKSASAFATIHTAKVGRGIRRTTRGGLTLSSNSHGLKAGAPLGTHRVKAALHHRLTITKPRDTRQRFKKAISGTSATGGKWKSARRVRFQHHLRLRKTRGAHVRHWRRKGHRLVPN